MQEILRKKSSTWPFDNYHECLQFLTPTFRSCIHNQKPVFFAGNFHRLFDQNFYAATLANIRCKLLWIFQQQTFCWDMFFTDCSDFNLLRLDWKKLVFIMSLLHQSLTHYIWTLLQKLRGWGRGESQTLKIKFSIFQNDRGVAVPKSTLVCLLVCLVLWHINLCRLFNAKSIFMYIISSNENSSV